MAVLSLKISGNWLVRTVKILILLCMATAGLTGLALLMMLVAYSTRTAAGAILVALLWRSNSRYSRGVSKIPIVLPDYGVLKSPKHRHKAGSRLRVGGKAKGSEKDRHTRTCKAGKQLRGWVRI